RAHAIEVDRCNVQGTTDVSTVINRIKSICYRQVRLPIPREVRIQMVPACSADVIIKEINRDCAGLRCRDSGSGSGGSSRHPFPAVAFRLEANAPVVLSLCFHGESNSVYRRQFSELPKFIQANTILVSCKSRPCGGPKLPPAFIPLSKFKSELARLAIDARREYRRHTAREGQ